MSPIILPLICVIVLLRITTAYLLPLTLDEAYYAQWSRHLAWGYLDHPPGAAIIGWFSKLWPSNALAVRAGAVAAGVITLLVALRTASLLNITDRNSKVALVLLLGLNIGGLGAGILTTPDAALALCWILALHEALAAMRTPSRWITFGLALGAGLLAKYIMVLFVPPLIYVLWRAQRRTLFSKEFLAGVIVAFCTFAPHLGWNAANNWATVRFQLKRGFTATHNIGLLDAQVYPATVKATPGTNEWQLADFFTPDPRDEKPKIEKSAAEKFFARTTNYAASIFVLWGALLVPLAFSWRRRRKQQVSVAPTEDNLLLRGLAVFPVVFFAFVALLTPVEANWPAVYMISASFLFSRWFAGRLMWLYVGAGVNALLLVLIISQTTLSGAQSLAPKNRISKETIAYQQLANWIHEQQEPVYASTYQIVAMSRFYYPGQLIDQWPGLTRRSELTRNPNLVERGPPTYNQGPFWVVSEERDAPIIEGYQISVMKEVRLCAESGLVETPAKLEKTGYYNVPCRRKSIATWYARRYLPQ